MKTDARDRRDKEIGKPFLGPQPLRVEHSLPLPESPLASRAPISLGPIDHEPVAAEGSLRARLMVPRAAVSPCPLQDLQMPPSCSSGADRLVPGAPIRMRPLKYAQVA